MMLLRNPYDNESKNSLKLYPFLGSGPIGGNDLWYHHILVKLCSLSLPFSSIPPLPPASRLALPAGSRPPSWLQDPPSRLQGPPSWL